MCRWLGQLSWVLRVFYYLLNAVKNTKEFILGFCGQAFQVCFLHSLTSRLKNYILFIRFGQHLFGPARRPVWSVYFVYCFLRFGARFVITLKQNLTPANTPA